jgi:hypothetical protein
VHPIPFGNTANPPSLRAIPEVLIVHQCSKCASSNLVVVHMTLGSGPVLFASCRECEHRWWTDTAGNRLLTFEEVLDRAAA